MKKIPLTHGKYALIDDEDYEIISLFNWYTGEMHNIFYAITKISLNEKSRILYMHRLILNAKPHEHTDHINHNGLDNRKGNIRKCTHQQNIMNYTKSKNCSSKYKGVCWHKEIKKWRAQIGFNGKQFPLGYFTDEIEAGKTYNKAAIKYFGEFASLNKI